MPRGKPTKIELGRKKADAFEQAGRQMTAEYVRQLKERVRQEIEQAYQLAPTLRRTH